MGLAVSLVSAYPEKVWYYDRRKWEGKTLSTKLASEGGCCIWCVHDVPCLCPLDGIVIRFKGSKRKLGVFHLRRYDEPQLLKAVERRLRSPIGSLDEYFAQEGAASKLDSLGQRRDGGLNARSHDHLLQLESAVAELAALETRAQHSFLRGHCSTDSSLRPGGSPSSGSTYDCLGDSRISIILASRTCTTAFNFDKVGETASSSDTLWVIIWVVVFGCCLVVLSGEQSFSKP
eukprot:4395303-Pleurochrysis_carterae.AAC.1